MTLYMPVLWIYVVMVSVVFGATVYEALVVHPAWSRKPPESFRGSTPPERLQVEARRWIRLNRIRGALVAISRWGALSTIASHG